MTFYDIIKNLDWEQETRSIFSKTAADVQKALTKSGNIDGEDFKALVSPSAQLFLENMARASYKITRQRFGNVIHMYIPIYLSNFCENKCVYCGFNATNKIPRNVLDDKSIIEEIKVINQYPFKHILLVTGEAPAKAGVDYFINAIRLMKKNFSQISLEVQPLNTNEYKQLVSEGLHGVYIYQETYNEKAYPKYHLGGKKSNYHYRLETPERLGMAGVHKIGLGNLIGLEDWRTEAYYTFLHLSYMRKTFWRSKYSISFPRLRPFAGEGFQPNVETTEKDLTQLICAYRIADPDVELSLSTRERAFYRNKAMALGITSMSAGSKTGPGGYGGNNELEQFAVNDDRDPFMVADSIRKNGFEPVWKDWSLYMQMA
ncbi:MAG: 2-iminoacetate synthase ThiH [Marinilabiliaceae bacterium]|nr:2-iminoacetate synthase ThiH [Marinilabiliaceae bacterium]